MHSRSALLGAILAGVCAALTALSYASVGAREPAAGVPDLSGRWRLDVALSDREPALRGARRRGRHRARSRTKADKPDKADPSGGATRPAQTGRPAVSQPRSWW